MSALEHVDKPMDGTGADGGKLHTLLVVPANFYAIPFGLIPAMK
jgi:hypothetical protein